MGISEHQTDEGEHGERDQETRRRILSAAESQFLAKGFKGVSMKEIADEVQVTAAALYYHFPEGKQALFLSVINQILEDWAEGALAVTTHAQGIREQLILLAQYMLTLQMRNLFALMRDIEALHIGSERRQDFMLKARARLSHSISRLFQEAIDRGELISSIPAVILATMYEGMIMSLQVGRKAMTQEINGIELSALSEMVVDGLLKGIAAREQ